MEGLGLAVCFRASPGEGEVVGLGLARDVARVQHVAEQGVSRRGPLRRVAAVGFHDGLEVVVQRKVLAHVRRQHLPRKDSKGWPSTAQRRKGAEACSALF